MPDNDRKIVPRQTAIIKGLNTYFTGQPCKRGHLAERYTKYKNCTVCTAENRIKHRAKDKALNKKPKSAVTPTILDLTATNKLLAL